MENVIEVASTNRKPNSQPTNTNGDQEMDRKTFRILVNCSVVLAAVAGAGATQANDVVIHAGSLIDGASKTERHQVSVIIHDDRIAAIQNGFVPAPKGGVVVDLADKTVLPGLIDCHDHITSTWRTIDPVRDLMTRTDEDDAIEATVSARDTLLAGFTSVRDVGASTSVVVALKRAISAGTIEGPRLWVAGPILGPTGGHSDNAIGINPEVHDPRWSEALVDGPEQARKTVRRLWREGVDLIKIAPSGGVLSPNDDPTRQLMQDDEIKAVIDTAHSLGMKVAAHAHGKQAIDRSITLGVDSIEHGSYADQSSYALFKAHGTYLVPTLLIGEEGLRQAEANPDAFDPSSLQKARIVVPMLSRNLHDAYKAGVKIAFGTDTEGLSKHGNNAREFALMVRAGMTPIDAILAATHNAADLIGKSDDIGAVVSGHFADIIAVTGDPLTDINVLEHVDFVMKGGKIVKENGKAL